MRGLWLNSSLSILALILVLIIAGCEQSSQEEIVVESWVSRYSQPGSNNEPVAIAVDKSGNVYVTGKGTGRGGQYDYVTLKYDGSGNEVWVARYDGTAGGDDRALAMAVDQSANVYVTGGSHGQGSYSDYVTAKYDSAGNELWIARYDGPVSEYDEALAIAVDQSANVYATGRSYDKGDNVDYATIKYDSTGNAIWVARYDGPAKGGEKANAIAVDDLGDVYVTGCSVGTSGLYDYGTIKYDSTGNAIWVARYSSPAGGQDFACAIAVDKSGSVYVTGGGTGRGGSYDYVTIKYDSSGNEVWVARYGGPTGGDDRALAMAVDQSANVYVTGTSYGKGDNTDYVTIKYDSAGNRRWVARYDGTGGGDDRALAIAVDQSANVYVTGTSYGKGGTMDYVTIKYDSAGNKCWVARYDSMGSGDDRALAIAVDQSANVYVTGNSQGGYVTIKYIQKYDAASTARTGAQTEGKSIK